MMLLWLIIYVVHNLKGGFIMIEKVEILGYFLEPDFHELEPLNVMVIYENYHETKGKFLTYFNPVEGHGEIEQDYFDECEPITKEDYLQASENYYTPEEYL
jgi:hypothetical protein